MMYVNRLKKLEVRLLNFKTMKATAVAPSNIAFIKYWGKRDEDLRIPLNSSISMNLSNLTTETTVEFSEKFEKDEVLIDGIFDIQVAKRVVGHLDRVRKLAGIKSRAKVISKNNFPASTGLSSSASGFAALTLAATAACGLQLSEKELSILARKGSGSACRSIPDGFVEWIAGNSDETSYAKSIFPVNWWDIVDIVCILSCKPKEIPTSIGQRYVSTSPFMITRLKKINNKIKLVKKYIANRDFTRFGEIVEHEALELHAIMMTSYPSLIYLYPESINLINSIYRLREEGLECYFTINTGHNLHIICLRKDIEKVTTKSHDLVLKDLIINESSIGVRLNQNYLDLQQT